MKLFTLWRITLLSALFSLLGMGSAWAQLTELEVGGVYHFTNVGYPDKAMGATNPQSVAGVAKDNTNKAQLWYVERKGDNGYALRNLGFGTYLQANGQSTRWTLASTTDADNSWITLEKVGNYTAFKGYTYGGYGYAHIDGGSNIVGWETSASATQWTITQKEMSDDDIQEALNIFTSVPTIQAHLDNLFSDKSCTTLKGAFDENNESYQALPTTLQAMVRKVAGNTSWEEANSDNSKAKWDAEYAKKYRVQLYEPYNEPECAAAALGVNAHTNLNNPTGIFANNGDVVYVMVGSEIQAGSSLYLTYHIGHGELSGYANGWELHQGLNVIPVYNNETNFCINYVVHTFDTSNGKKGNKAKARKLSDYKPIKIHIEGGHINGYWNKVGDELYAADNNDTWNYLEARATQKTVTVLGKYITLQFPLLDEHTVDTDGNTNKGLATYFNDLVKIEDCINEWDNVMLWERLLLGVLDKNTINAEAKQSPYSITDSKKVFEYTGEDGEFESDYSDYYNVHGLSYGIPNSYMYGGWAHCGYNFNTMAGIIQNLPTNAGSHWGPGHEIGHQHQALLTVNGLTEVTNNLFSNVVLWYYGETTSRYNGSEGALSNVLAQFNAEGTDFFSNNIWAQTIMYYKLFLYYHVLGHNPKFYPRLFEMLRQDPMSTGYAQDGSKCLMHFYKKCCLAAGEDLTEFFRAHGFFEVMENRLVGDYSNSVYNLTQAQIDAAIKEVEDLGYEKNIAVLFINDATGETIKSHKGDDLAQYGETTICSEIGSYASFATATTPSYNYAMLGTTVTMEGTGGVGFAIFNEKGEIIGFSDKKTFEISNETALLIASGKAEIKTINADQSEVKAVDILKTVSKEEVRAALLEILNKVKADVIDLTDETNSQKPGFYKARDIVALTAAYDKAKTAYEEENSNAYQTVIEELNVAYLKVLNSTNNRVPIVAGTTYVLTSKKYPNKSMNNTDSGLTGAETNSNSSSQQWVLESAGSENTFYIKSKSTNYYLGNLAQSTKISATADKAGATPYLAIDLGAGLWALQCQTESDKQSLHCDGSSNIVGWAHTGTGDDGSWWYLTGVESEEVLSKFLLEDLIEQTEALINEVGVITTHTQKVDLTEASYHSNAECKDTRNGDQFTSYNVLCDNDPSTFFHSDYSEEAPNKDHYIRMDVGEGNELEEFNLYYTTRKDGNLCAPTKMAIEGSNDDKTWDIIRDITSGLPTSNNTAHTIAGLKGDKAYRYIRMRVYMNSTDQQKNGRYYFIVSELGLQEVTYQVAPNTLYASIEAETLQEAFNQQNAAIEILSTATSQDDINNAYTALLSKYNALKDAKQTVENATLNAKKEVLKTLINNTTTLIGQCGTVTYTPATFNGEAPLQVTDANGKFYVSTNADQNTGDGKNDGGGIAALVDNDEGTYFHTRWEGATVSEPHYFQVDLGEELSTNNFTFSYKPRNGSPAPTAMKVYGSNDGTTFTDVLATITEGLPAHDSGNTYQSSTISSEISYRYLRFTVTASDGPGDEQHGDQYFFGMLEFDLNLIGSPETYTAQLNQNIGEVTNDILIAAYKENAEAQSAYYYATTEAQVEKAIADLQAQYDALAEAKANIYRQELRAKITELAGLIAQCGEVAYDAATDTYTATVDPNAGSVTEELLISAAQAKAAAEEVANTSTDQAALTAEKDKLATLCEALQEALATKLYPVTITTDEANPVLYTMKSRRGDNKAVQYLPADGHKFNISDMSAGSAVQAYYFTVGTERGQVYVHPYAARGMVLAANDTGDGADKAFATEMGSATYEEWKFVEATENGVKWYSLQPVGTSTYFSNYGGVSNKMGFYSYADAGSRLQFVSTTVEGSVAYNTLKSYYDGLPGTIEGSDDKVGYYPVTQATAYNQAYNQATMVLNYGGTPVESTILSAGDLVASTTARVIGINSIWLDNYDKWVNELGYIADLGFDQVISLEPVTEGQAGSYYLKMVHAGEMGYFQTSGYTIGAKETAQVFVPIAASTSGTGNAQYNNTDWDNSGNSDATKLVRFVRGSASGTDWLNPGSRTYANGKGPWTVFNVHALEFTTTEDQYFAAYEALKSAYEGMAINLPKEGGYYTIQSVSRGEGKFAYANPADNKMYWGGKTATSSEVVWKFEDNGDGTYTVSNMHTGTMMNTFINNDASPLNPSSGSVTLKSLAPDGQIGIYSGNQMMHAQGSGSGEIVHWATGANDASAWRIVETDLSNVKYDLTISKYGLAGLHLNYPVEVPDDVNVTAYYVSMAEGANGIAKLTKIKDGIIPANEGVILEGTENATISLPYVNGDVAAISENLLEGANYTGYIQGEQGTKYYLFGAKSGKVGLYWTYLQYNADGKITDGNANTDKGTHFKCSANKVYLPYSDGSGVAKFSFRFDDTTGIDDLLNGLNGEQLIYDLQGRRILKVTESGIYIVNGQKRYIHAK